MSRQGNPLSYTIGFVLSVFLTLGAYDLVVRHILTGWTLAYVIVGLALLQLLVQLLFFLHLGQETGPRWKLLVFDFTLLVVIIVVVASLWIMNNLNYHMMPQQSEQQLVQEEGIRH